MPSDLGRGRHTNGTDCPILSCARIRPTAGCHARSTYNHDPEQVRNVDPVVALVPKAASTSDRQITLQLDCRHPDWSGARYRALVEWFKARGKSVDIFPCRPLVAETMWDMAARAAQRHGDERTIVPPVDDEQRPSTGNDRASNVPSGDKNGLEPQNIRKTVVPTTSAPPDTQDINVPRGGSTLVLSSEPLKDRPSSNTGMITPGENVRDTSQGSEGQVPGTHAQLFGSLHGIAPTANTRISPPANRMSLGTSHRLLQSTNMRDASQPSLRHLPPRYYRILLLPVD
ncbi:hypothetical protein DFH07DRAFT_385756 [Mycena maculata]|uniref:Uncharacterized protein n=1 Tax=Mycena maculata TaxID=230809 RepID=A0AAD7KAG8_9AGAR|nr:hypothetical protein DFH07DRAFT_385756 [Mycena maculata]